MKACWMFLSLLLFAPLFHAKFYFKETFNESWKKRWIESSWHESDGMKGNWIWTAGKWYGDPEKDKGIQTTPDAKFFAISSEFPETFDNKDSDLVIQYSVKHEQKIDCGGGYIKVLPESSKDLMGKEFTGDTPYFIMFGPDICGGKKKVHVIIWHNGTNHMIKEEIRAKSDELTHLYTLYINPKNEYKVFIDLEEVSSGDLFKHWEIVKPKTIKDPDAKKPDDWDERKEIPDPNDVKPEGFDDIPEYIPDTQAVKPDDWSDSFEDAWEPPKIKNPEYKGEWKPKMIPNPNHQGKWKPPEIPNPEYVEDNTIYHHPDMKFVGFELWQVKSGSIFDNIVVGDDLEEALQFGRDTFLKSKDDEKAMYDKIKKEKRSSKDDDFSNFDSDDDDDDNEDDFDVMTQESDDDEDYDETHDEL